MVACSALRHQDGSEDGITIVADAAERKTIAGKAPAKLPAWFHRLPPAAQRAYLKSDAIDRYQVTAGVAIFSAVAALMRALEGGASSIVERAAQGVAAVLCRLLEVRPVKVEVRNVRPHNTRGELHGIFYPRGPARVPSSVPGSLPSRNGEPLIILWMRTAQRHDVVKPKTFLRTLVHELGHYLDYAHLRLGDSYHTMGFYKRESFLVRMLMPSDELAVKAKAHARAPL
jgi:hypothetical protein